MRGIDVGLMTVLSADQQSVAAGSLGALGCTGVYHGIAPKGYTLPLIRFHQMAAPRDPSMGANGIYVINAVYAVLCVDEGDDHDRASTLAARVEELLDRQPLPVSDGLTHMRTLVDRDLDLPDHSEGRQLQQIGANYRVWVHK